MGTQPLGKRCGIVARLALVKVHSQKLEANWRPPPQRLQDSE
jgi:hypothetical protein